MATLASSGVVSCAVSNSKGNNFGKSIKTQIEVKLFEVLRLSGMHVNVGMLLTFCH